MPFWIEQNVVHSASLRYCAPIHHCAYEYFSVVSFKGPSVISSFFSVSCCVCVFCQAMTDDFRAYQEQVLRNSKRMSDALVQRGYHVVSGGTDNHLLLLDLRPTVSDSLQAFTF